ncbi:MAG: porin, partial [Gammaproteobacteria bacterium]
MKTCLLPIVLCTALLSGAVAAAEPPAPGIEELWKIIQQQQAEIDALKQQQQETAQQASQADDKAEAAVVAVEDARQEGTASGNWTDKTTLGGYAELHYNNLDGSGGAKDKDEIDLHRFVVFLGHEFNENIRFFSEVEIEHGIAGEEQVGEVEVEQAYVEFDLNDRHGARTGVT